ncbi:MULTISPECIES: hypothetical protein [Cysteiniphilum]|uniref:Uncharacterized protein n=1 Tax=Cysteiniphilum litorale TaxID=2056700 RepID=A0A8J2Z370_9GAMM|nr:MULTISPECIES: hypothetical protein [Cysteiniphilum]GGF91456.1 hypothetical protein GCM10010995_05860 [Cysteiniphilum litorale]
MKNENIYKLKNGKTAKIIGFDDWDRILIKIYGFEQLFCIVSGKIYSRTKDYGEPCSPLNDDHQPLPREMEKIRSSYYDSCSF